jgi:hypothetical protein
MSLKAKERTTLPGIIDGLMIDINNRLLKRESRVESVPGPWYSTVGLLLSL